MKTSIGKAAKELGVSRDTLRRWEKSGKITAERTTKGHRRYNLALLMGASPRKNQTKKKAIVYARVSSHDQKEDLVRQVQVLEAYCAANGWIYEVIEESLALPSNLPTSSNMGSPQDNSMPFGCRWRERLPLLKSSANLLLIRYSPVGGTQPSVWLSVGICSPNLKTISIAGRWDFLRECVRNAG